MQLPSVDRTPSVRPAGADSVSSGANRVIPVAPVNPAVSASPSLEPVPSIIDKVNPALKAPEAEPGHTSVSDPAKPGSEAATGPKDWTIHRPAPEKVQDPPPKPLSKVLMDHLKTVWTASANAIQLEQAKDLQAQRTTQTPAEVPGTLAKQNLVYSPSKVKKNEKL